MAISIKLYGSIEHNVSLSLSLDIPCCLILKYGHFDDTLQLKLTASSIYTLIYKNIHCMTINIHYIYVPLLNEVVINGDPEQCPLSHW